MLMVFTRKDGDFHGRAVSFREGYRKNDRSHGSLEGEKNAKLSIGNFGR